VFLFGPSANKSEKGSNYPTGQLSPATERESVKAIVVVNASEAKRNPLKKQLICWCDK
jgi:hypothetical protein